MTASPMAVDLWPEVGIDPVKVALPNDRVGYTLRAYRPASEITPTEVTRSEEDNDDPFAARERQRAAEAAELDDTLIDHLRDPAATGTEFEEPDPADFAQPTDEESAAEQPDEEVPLFLSRRGRLLLFATPESLVEFIGSDQPHDLRQLDSWSTLVARVRPGDVAPSDDDTYELDLVVENLRGGPDGWDLPLLIAAGEFARDLGHALRLPQVIEAMGAGSPLDDLDEALRAAAAGGLGSLFARRRLRRFGAQQASLGWRTVIGKISGAVDWRD